MKIKRVIYILVGVISTICGIFGIFLPILPTTPFLLLSIWCFSRSSVKLEKFVRNNKYFGKYIDDYYKGEGISLNSKRISITVLWLGITFSNFILLENHYIQAMLTFIAIFVTVHILGNPTREYNKNESCSAEGKASLSQN